MLIMFKNVFKVRSLWLGLLALMVSGCAGGFVSSYRSEGFTAQWSRSERIVCIAPTLRWFGDREFDDEVLPISLKLQPLYVKNIEAYAKKTRIPLEVIRPGADRDELLFRYLLPLKQQILRAISVQRNPLNEDSQRNQVLQTYTVNTLLPAECAEWASKADARYVSIIDTYSSDERSILIHIVADLKKGQIEFQEIRGYSKGLRNVTLKGFIYDTLNALKQATKEERK